MTEIAIRIPSTAADLIPPKQASVNVEASNCLRKHYDEVSPFFKAISGEIASIHGDVGLDEAACVFKVKEIAQTNGFDLLGTVPTVTLRKAIRTAWKGMTGHSVGELRTQGRLIHRTEAQAD